MTATPWSRFAGAGTPGLARPARGLLHLPLVMPRLLIPTLVLGVMAAPAAAWACDPAILFGDSRPPDDGSVVIPAYGLVLVETPWFANARFEATLTDPGAGFVQRLDVYPVSPDHVLVPVENLNDFTDYQLALQAPDYGLDKTIRLRSNGAFDDFPPSEPGRFRLTARAVAEDPCRGTGWWLDAEFLPSVDDQGVAAYVLTEFSDAGELYPVGITFHPIGFEPEGLSFSTFTYEGGERCFQLLAVDYGSNASDFEQSPQVCLRLGPPGPIDDGGVTPPPIDAGLWDGGVPDTGVVPIRPDAGPRPDGGSLSGLNEAEGVGCGCSAAEDAEGPRPWAWAWAWALLLALRRRRGVRE